MNKMPVETKQDIYALLESIGANRRLIRHLELVGEAAEIICEKISAYGVTFDQKLVELGVAAHDAGKIEYPQELDNPGNRHELAGQALLLRNGIPPDIARCCLSHAQYGSMEVSFEELLVALSDKLWKGKRDEALEMRVIEEIAIRVSKDRWDLFTDLDCAFEEIASSGDERLGRSTR